MESNFHSAVFIPETHPGIPARHVDVVAPMTPIISQAIVHLNTERSTAIGVAAHGLKHAEFDRNRTGKPIPDFMNFYAPLMRPGAQTVAPIFKQWAMRFSRVHPDIALNTFTEHAPVTGFMNGIPTTAELVPYGIFHNPGSANGNQSTSVVQVQGTASVYNTSGFTIEPRTKVLLLPFPYGIYKDGKFVYLLRYGEKFAPDATPQRMLEFVDLYLPMTMPFPHNLCAFQLTEVFSAINRIVDEVPGGKITRQKKAKAFAKKLRIVSGVFREDGEHFDIVRVRKALITFMSDKVFHAVRLPFTTHLAFFAYTQLFLAYLATQVSVLSDDSSKLGLDSYRKYVMTAVKEMGANGVDISGDETDSDDEDSDDDDDSDSDSDDEHDNRRGRRGRRGRDSDSESDSDGDSDSDDEDEDGLLDDDDSGARQKSVEDMAEQVDRFFKFYKRFAVWYSEYIAEWKTTPVVPRKRMREETASGLYKSFKKSHGIGGGGGGGGDDDDDDDGGDDEGEKLIDDSPSIYVMSMYSQAMHESTLRRYCVGTSIDKAYPGRPFQIDLSLAW